ncbi:MAG: 50S ribosomal protein L4 [Dehalococcoidia bacterium]
MKFAVHDASGKETRQIELADEVFGIEPNRDVVHQVYVAQMNARRIGTANTKTRGEVRGSTAKLRRQKGLGRARIGSMGSPVLTGGGVAFGPKTRSYVQTVPKRIRRLAIRSVLSAKASDGELIVVDSIGSDSPSTSALRVLLAGLGVERSSLIVTGQPDRTAFLSARNLRNARVVPASYLNVADLINHHGLVMTTEAVRQTEALWGGERATSRRAALVTAVVDAEASAPSAGEKPKRARRAAKAVVAATDEQPEAAAPAAPAAKADAPEKPAPRKRRAARKPADAEGSA